MEMAITRVFTAFFGKFNLDQGPHDPLLTNLASCGILALGRFCCELAALGTSRPLTNTPQYHPHVRFIRDKYYASAFQERYYSLRLQATECKTCIEFSLATVY